MLIQMKCSEKKVKSIYIYIFQSTKEKNENGFILLYLLTFYQAWFCPPIQLGQSIRWKPFSHRLSVLFIIPLKLNTLMWSHYMYQYLNRNVYSLKYSEIVLYF